MTCYSNGLSPILSTGRSTQQLQQTTLTNASTSAENLISAVTAENDITSMPNGEMLTTYSVPTTLDGTNINTKATSTTFIYIGNHFKITLFILIFIYNCKKHNDILLEW